MNGRAGRWTLLSSHSFFLRSLLILTAALVPVLIALAVLGRLYSEAERRTIEVQRDDTALKAVLIVERQLAERIGTLETLAAAYREVGGDIDRFHQIARQAGARLGETVVLVNRSGSLVMSTSDRQGEALPQREDMGPIQPVFERGRPYVSDIVIGSLSEQPMVVLSVPVFMEGQTDLALSASISSAALGTALSEAGLQEGWIAALIDRQGRFVARTQGGEKYTGKPARPELVDIAIAGEPGGTFYNVTYEGVPVESSYRRSHLAGWTVVMAVPAAILRESLYRTRWIIASLFVLALVTASAFAAFAGRRVVSAMHALQTGALALGRGERFQWETRGITEFDDVGNALAKAQDMLTQRDAAKSELFRTASLLESIINLTPDLVYVKDRQSRTILTNPATLALYGKQLSEVKGHGAIDWHPQTDEVERIVANDRAVMESGESMQFEEPFTGVNGRRVFLSTKSPWRNEAGEIIGVVGVSTDITDREQRAQHMEFVMRELSHRSKNLLTIIQSVARQTARQVQDFDEFHRAFDSRIQALAALHDLLVRRDWKGAGLEEIIRSQLRAFANSDRLYVEGPDIVLSPAVAQVCAMAFHELATNATKYGALCGNGIVSVQWRIEDGKLILEWAESGGPVVKAPTRSGFGSIVLRRIATNIPQAQIQFDFPPEGVRWRFTAELAYMIDAARHPSSQSDQDASFE